MKQIKNIIVKRIIGLFTKISEEEPAKWAEVQKVYGNVLKMGAVEDTKNRDKLAPLCRFTTNFRNDTSLDQVCAPALPLFTWMYFGYVLGCVLIRCIFIFVVLGEQEGGPEAGM